MARTVKEAADKTEIYFMRPEESGLIKHPVCFSRIDRDRYRSDMVEVVVPSLLQGGDYGNTGFVGLANYRAFCRSFEDHPDVTLLHGAYGSYGVAILATCEDEEIVDTLCSLADYPVIDEDVLSEVEEEAKEEAWDSWAANDLERALREHFDTGDARAEEEMAPEALRTLFYTLQDRSGHYMEADGNAMWVRIERLVEAADSDDFEGLFTK